MRLTILFMLFSVSYAQKCPISWWRPTSKAPILMEEYVRILYPILGSTLKHACTAYFCAVMS